MISELFFAHMREELVFLTDVNGLTIETSEDASQPLMKHFRSRDAVSTLMHTCLHLL